MDFDVAVEPGDAGDRSILDTLLVACLEPFGGSPVWKEGQRGALCSLVM
jgi:hypothetical protein